MTSEAEAVVSRAGQILRVVASTFEKNAFRATDVPAFTHGYGVRQTFVRTMGHPQYVNVDVLFPEVVDKVEVEAIAGIETKRGWITQRIPRVRVADVGESRLAMDLLSNADSALRKLELATTKSDRLER